MLDAIAIDLIRPPTEQAQLITGQHLLRVGKRGGKQGRSDKTDPPAQPRTQWINQALFVGAIVLMTGNDGTQYPCQIIGQDPDGTWQCKPVQGN